MEDAEDAVSRYLKQAHKTDKAPECHLFALCNEEERRDEVVHALIVS